MNLLITGCLEAICFIENEIKSIKEILRNCENEMVALGWESVLEAYYVDLQKEKNELEKLRQIKELGDRKNG